MKVIEQKRSKYDIRVSKSEGNIYLYQDGEDCIEQDCLEIDVYGAKELIKVLQEFVDENN